MNFFYTNEYGGDDDDRKIEEFSHGCPSFLNTENLHVDKVHRRRQTTIIMQVCNNI